MRTGNDGEPFVRRIEQIFDISPDEQVEHMRNRVSEIREKLVADFRTKQKNLWFQGTFEKIRHVAEIFSLKALDQKANLAAVDFVGEVFENLVSKGEILRMENKGDFVFRSRMRTEKKLQTV